MNKRMQVVGQGKSPRSSARPRTAASSSSLPAATGVRSRPSSAPMKSRLSRSRNQEKFGQAKPSEKTDLVVTSARSLRSPSSPSIQAWQDAHSETDEGDCMMANAATAQSSAHADTTATSILSDVIIQEEASEFSAPGSEGECTINTTQSEFLDNLGSPRASSQPYSAYDKSAATAAHAHGGALARRAHAAKQRIQSVVTIQRFWRQILSRKQNEARAAIAAMCKGVRSSMGKELSFGLRNISAVSKTSSVLNASGNDSPKDTTPNKSAVSSTDNSRVESPLSMSVSASREELQQRSAKRVHAARTARMEALSMLSPPKRVVNQSYILSSDESGSQNKSRNKNQSAAHKEKVQMVADQLRKEIGISTSISSSSADVRLRPTTASQSGHGSSSQLKACCVLQATIRRRLYNCTASKPLALSSAEDDGEVSSLDPRAQLDFSAMQTMNTTSNVTQDDSCTVLPQDEIKGRETAAKIYSSDLGEHSRTIETSHNLQSERAKSLLSFLDEAEASCNATSYSGLVDPDASISARQAQLSAQVLSTGGVRNQEGFITPSSVTASSVLSSGYPSTGGRSSASTVAAEVFGGMKAKMAALQVEADERAKLAKELRTALERERQRRQEDVASAIKNGEKQVEHVREEMERALETQLQLSDKLVKDKSSLTDKCEELANQISRDRKEFDKKLADMEERHGVEVKKTRDHTIASEKSRRQEWVQAKQNEIKEMTIKGLQPEIERIIAKHKAEIKALHEKHSQDMELSDQQHHAELERRLAEIRDRLLSEREHAIEAERESAMRRLREAQERSDAQLQAARLRWTNESEAERDRILSAARSERLREEEGIQRLREDHARELRQLREVHSNERAEASKAHADEVNALRKEIAALRSQSDNQSWARMQSEIAKREAEMKNRLSRERDEEIERVISRLEEDVAREKRDLHTQAEKQVAAVQRQAEAAGAAARAREKELTEKYLELYRGQSTADGRLTAALEGRREAEQQAAESRRSLMTANEKIQELETAMRTLKGSLSAEATSAIEEERAMRRAIEAELSQALSANDEQKARHEGHMTELRKEKDVEFEQLELRVRTAMTRKDGVIDDLRYKLGLAEARVGEYESLLEKQRKELLA